MSSAVLFSMNETKESACKHSIRSLRNLSHVPHGLPSSSVLPKQVCMRAKVNCWCSRVTFWSFIPCSKHCATSEFGTGTESARLTHSHVTQSQLSNQLPLPREAPQPVIKLSNHAMYWSNCEQIPAAQVSRAHALRGSMPESQTQTAREAPSSIMPTPR